jgi:ABC-type phosphate transport system permease subunit
MYAKPSEPHPIGGVLDDSIRLYRASFKIALPLALIAEIPMAAQRIYLQSLAKGITPNNPQAMLAIFQDPVVWLSYLVTVCVFLVFYIALLANVDAVARGAPISLGRAVARGLRLFPRMVGSFVMIFIAAIIGTLLLVVPGIYLYGALYLAGAAIVVDDEDMFASLATSMRLTWGNWWRSVITYSVIVIIVFIVVGVLAAIVGGVFVGVYGVRSVQSIIANEVVEFVVGVGAMSLTPAAILSIYYDLKLRREGSDLAERVQALPTR